MKWLYLLTYAFALSGCFGRDEPEVVVAPAPAPIRYEVRAGQWTSCWISCGKKDTLLAVTETACICRDGKRFVHAFPADETREPEKSVFEKSPVSTTTTTATVRKVETQPEKKEPSKSIFDMLKSLGE
jgi:hypothetical protein